MTQLAGVPTRLQEIEVECLVEFVLAYISGQPLWVPYPCLGNRDALAAIAIENLPPLAVDLVHAVMVEVGTGRNRVTVGPFQPPDIPEQRILHQSMRHVHPEPVHAAIEPEPQDRLELGCDVGVLPVQVRLFGGEQMEVPLGALCI